jgi:hypothetical protein
VRGPKVGARVSNTNRSSSDQPVGVTASNHVLQADEEVDPFARLYWFPSQTVPTVPVAAGSGLAPE